MFLPKARAAVLAQEIEDFTMALLSEHERMLQIQSITRKPKKRLAWGVGCSSRRISPNFPDGGHLRSGAEC
jgi:hypothetical protein